MAADIQIPLVFNDAKSDISILERNDEIVQRLNRFVETVLGTLFKDRNIGIPYYDMLFLQPSTALDAISDILVTNAVNRYFGDELTISNVAVVEERNSLAVTYSYSLRHERTTREGALVLDIEETIPQELIAPLSAFIPFTVTPALTRTIQGGVPAYEMNHAAQTITVSIDDVDEVYSLSISPNNPIVVDINTYTSINAGFRGDTLEYSIGFSELPQGQIHFSFLVEIRDIDKNVLVRFIINQTRE